MRSGEDLKAPDLCPGHFTDLLLFLKVEETKEIRYPAVWRDVRLSSDTAVGQVGLDGYNGQLIFIHRLQNVNYKIIFSKGGFESKSMNILSMSMEKTFPFLDHFKHRRKYSSFPT